MAGPASHRFCTGAETYFTLAGDLLVMFDARAARTGRGYFKARKTAEAHPTGGTPYDDLGMEPIPAPPPGGSLSGTYKTRFWVRCPGALPTTDVVLFRIQGQTLSANWGVVLKSSGAFALFLNNSSTPSEGDPTTSAIPANVGPDPGQFVKVEYTLTVTNRLEVDTDSLAATATITFPNGEETDIFHNRSGLELSAITINIASARLCGKCADSAYQTGGAATLTMDLDFDDWVFAGNADLPTQERVTLMMPTGQGSLDGWTGDWWQAAKCAAASAADMAQVATSAGARTTFAHDAITTLAGPGATVGLVTLYYFGSVGSATAPKFIINGDDETGFGSIQSSPPRMSSATQMAWISTTSTSEWGVESVHATDNKLHGLIAEVLHDGTAHSPAEVDEVGYHHRWVEWTGDGTTRQVVSGVGFIPHAVLPLPLATNGTGYSVMHTVDMPPGWALSQNGEESGLHLLGLTTDGFIVGPLANVSGVHYVALCVRDDGNGVGGRIFASGGFLGLSQTVTFPFTVAFQPDVLFATGYRATKQTWIKHAGMGTASYRLPDGSASAAQALIAITANGFTTGTDATLAAAGAQTLWWAFRIPAALDDQIKRAKIAGQSADAVVQLAAGRAPYAVLLRGTGGAAGYWRFNEAEFSGVNNTDWDGGAIGFGGGIIALNAGAGTFTIDGNAVHLDDSPVVDAYYLAWTQVAALGPPTAADEAYATAYRTLLTVDAPGLLTNDDANGGGALSAVLEEDVSVGVLAIASDGSFTYTPPEGFDGVVTFTYRAVNAGTSAPATVSITVAPPIVPIAVDDTYSTPYRTPLLVAAPGVLGNDDANGGGSLSAVLEDDVATGTLALASDGGFTYTPPHAFDGPVTFTYRAGNGDADALATATITVAPAHVPIPTEVGLLFIRIMIAGTAYMLAETELADDPSWHYGFKPAQLIAVSDIARELSRDGYRTQSWSFEIADVDRQWRGLSRTHSIEGAYVALYSVDDDVRRAEGAPYRLAAGFVSVHKGVGGFRYTFTVEDVLGRRLADWMAQPTLPPKRLSLVEFPGMDPSNDGKPAPIGYGALSDSDEDVPQGVVPALFMGTINLSAIGGIDLVVDAYIFVAHAVADIADLYYNPQTWAGEIVVEVGDVVRPTPSNVNGHLFRATVAGTAAGTEPTWPTSGTVVDGGVTWEEAGTDDPLLRYVVPDGAFGTLLVCPHKPLWSAATNLAVQYVDYNGVRYTPLFVLHSHRLAKAAREGRVVITANLDGFETVGDGTGTTLVYPEDVLEHLLANYTFGTWVTGAPLPLGDIDDVAILDGAALAAAKAISVARGYQVAFLVGVDGNQEPVFDVIGGLLEGTGLEMGANRHGQLLVSREDELAPAAVTYDATLDAVDDHFNTEPDRETRCNRVEHVYARRYVALNAPTPTPAEGEPLPTKTLPPSAEWASGLTVVEDPVAQAAVGRVITRTLDNHVVRDPATAGDIAARALAQGVGIGRGTSLAQDGSKIVTFMTGFQGLSKDGVEVELGTVIGIEHPEGLSAIGWPPGAPARVRVRQIRIAPIAHTVTLSGRLLGWTPPAGSEEEGEEMAFFRGELGGSRETPLPLAGAVANARSWRDVTIPNLSAAAIANARAKVECRTVDAATSITLELYNVSDDTVAFTFDPCTETDVEYEGANQRQDKAVVVVVGKTYRLRGTPSNDTHPTFAADGVLELYG